MRPVAAAGEGTIRSRVEGASAATIFQGGCEAEIRGFAAAAAPSTAYGGPPATPVRIAPSARMPFGYVDQGVATWLVVRRASLAPDCLDLLRCIGFGRRPLPPPFAFDAILVHIRCGIER